MFNYKRPNDSMGFTLIELMVTVAIVAILSAIAYPSYQSYVLQSRRADAVSGLLDLQQRVEKYRANNVTYDTYNGGVPTSDYYDFSVATVTATATTNYTLSATAKSSQTADTGCGVLTLNQDGAKEPISCWKK